jgi:hypothetical protein
MKALDAAIKRLRDTFDGDSNDAEHDAAVALVDLLGGEFFVIPGLDAVRLVPMVCAFVTVPKKLRYDFDAALDGCAWEGSRLISGDGVPVDDLDYLIETLGDDSSVELDQSEKDTLEFLKTVRAKVEADNYLFQ